jgi:DNA-binding transcriptional LysR family regulator
LGYHCISWTTLGPYRAWGFRDRAGDKSAIELVPIKVRLSTTSHDSAVLAALDGVGLLQATSYQVEKYLRTGELVAVLREFEAPPMLVSLVYASQRIFSLKLGAFLDFAAPRLPSMLNDISSVVSSTTKKSK